MIDRKKMFITLSDQNGYWMSSATKPSAILNLNEIWFVTLRHKEKGIGRKESFLCIKNIKN